MINLILNLLATPFVIVGAAARFMFGSFMTGWFMVDAWIIRRTCGCEECRKQQ